MSSAQDIVLLEAVGIGAITTLGHLANDKGLPHAATFAGTGLLAGGLMVVAKVNGKTGIMLGGIALAGAALSAVGGKSLGEGALTQLSKVGKGASPAAGPTASEAYAAIGSKTSNTGVSQAAAGVVAGINNPALTGGAAGAAGVAINAGKAVLGTPYSWGGGTPSGPTLGIAQGARTVGFDCSSLMQYVAAKAGVSLPRDTYHQINSGTPVANIAQAKPGDLLFPSTHHVQMYLGNGMVLEAPQTGGHVQVVPRRSSYIAIRRIF